MIQRNRVEPTPAPDLLDDAGLEFIARAPAEELAALVSDEGGDMEGLAASAGGAVARALKAHEAQRLYVQLRALSTQALPRTRAGLLELAGLLHGAAASAGLVVSLQQMDLDSLSDEQLCTVITRLQDICAEYRP
ncbi:MAG: hypothetical protein O9341_21330 [Paucibacter sp.]|nr:hypothetical protein [Roseateles sp.]